MIKKIKVIIIPVLIILLLFLAYKYFLQEKEIEPGLVSSAGEEDSSENLLDKISEIGKDFLPLLLSVKNLQIDNTIFSEPAFTSLQDSSIELLPDGNEGRPNPFAPIGTDIVEISIIEPETTNPLEDSVDSSVLSDEIQEVSQKGSEDQNSDLDDIAEQLDQLLNLDL